MPTYRVGPTVQEVGLVRVEGHFLKHYPMIGDLGLDVSLVASHGFKTGPVDPSNL